MATADLLLHPVRLRIVEAFLGDRALTTSALAAELADVPPASLYRHVARLVDAGSSRSSPSGGCAARWFAPRCSAWPRRPSGWTRSRR